MNKILFNSIYPFKNCIFYNNFSHVFKLDDDTVFKMFNRKRIVTLMDNDYDVEENILEASNFVCDPNIVAPSDAVYNESGFIGYTMPFVSGIPIINFIDDNTPLSEITDLYCKIESIVKRNSDIVFPDMITDGNILIDSDSNVYFIDFDGFQIRNYLTPAISSGLGNRENYVGTKYKNGRAFTKELDIKSLIYLYFSMVFAYPLEDYDNCCSFYSVEDWFCDLFHYLGIENDELFDKVLKLYKECPNEYLGNTVLDIVRNYDLEVSNDDGYVKRLVRK